MLEPRDPCACGRMGIIESRVQGVGGESGCVVLVQLDQSLRQICGGGIARRIGIRLEFVLREYIAISGRNGKVNTGTTMKKTTRATASEAGNGALTPSKNQAALRSIPRAQRNAKPAAKVQAIRRNTWFNLKWPSS